MKRVVDRWWRDGRPDGQSDKAGEAICEVFDADSSTAYDAAVKVVAETSDATKPNVFVKADVAAYCPQCRNEPPSD